jgi:uncharacterized protein (TIGR02301 family)
MTRKLLRALLFALLAPAPTLAQEFPFNLFGGDKPARTRAAPRASEQWRRGAAGASHAPRQGRRETKNPAPLTPKPQQTPAQTPAEPPPAPYDPQLQRLAEILGGLSYLRDLCGDRDGEEWRRMMARLREADAPAGMRRQKLTAAFNRGFSSYELTYRACTANARVIIERSLAEAQGLAREVSTRYGNP